LPSSPSNRLSRPCAKREQPCEHLGWRVNAGVIPPRRVDHWHRGCIDRCLTDMVGVSGGDVGTHQEVDESMRFVGVRKTGHWG